MSKRRIIPIAAAVAALVASLVLGGLQSVVWHGAEAPGLAKLIAGLLDPSLLAGEAASAAAAPPAVYFAYGRSVLGVYGLLGLAALGVLPLLGDRVVRAAKVCALIAVFGDVLAYWVSAWLGPGVRQVGFWYLEVPALLGLTLLSTAAGIAAFLRKRSGTALALALPAALLGTIALRYLPHGILLGLAAVLCAGGAANAGRT